MLSDAMQLVNERLAGSIFGTNEIDDFVIAFYDGWEEFKNYTPALIFKLLSNISIDLYMAYKDSNIAFAEGKDLQDDEIEKLVNLADNFKLGDSAPKARAIVKSALTLIQSYFIFNK